MKKLLFSLIATITIGLHANENKTKTEHRLHEAYISSQIIPIGELFCSLITGAILTEAGRFFGLEAKKSKLAAEIALQKKRLTPKIIWNQYQTRVKSILAKVALAAPACGIAHSTWTLNKNHMQYQKYYLNEIKKNNQNN